MSDMALAPGGVVHVLPPEYVKEHNIRSNIKKCIRLGDRHDRLLRALFGGPNWAKKTPASCDCYWVEAPRLQALTGTTSLATDIWVCRKHLEHRWPGWTIVNDDSQMVRGEHTGELVRRSIYRVVEASTIKQNEPRASRTERSPLTAGSKTDMPQPPCPVQKPAASLFSDRELQAAYAGEL